MDVNLRPELGAFQKLEQTLRLSPAMIQSMEILQLASLDLQEKIEQELESNPVLDIAEEGESTPEEGHGAIVEEREREPEEDFARLEDFRESFNAPWDDAPYAGARVYSGEDPKLEAMQNVEGHPLTLAEHLGGQMRFVTDDARRLAVASEVIGNLDESGYLIGTLDEIRLSLADWDPPPTAEEIADVFHLVQSLDPPGVGARDLRECLLLQLARETQAPTLHLRLAVQIIQHHLEDLGHNRLPRIVRDVKRASPDLEQTTVEDVKEAHRIIASFDPRPGRMFGGTRQKYVRPDILVDKIDGRYEVRVETGYYPRLKLRNEYRDLLSRRASDAQTRSFLRGKFQDAEFLMKAIGLRENTLQRIATEIVSLQSEFLDHGMEHLRPLRLQDVAERLGMHLSTVSRAISGKYLQCPRGIFEIKFFFPGGASRQDGTTESRNSVVVKLKDVIDREDKRHPLSDEQIAEALQAQGVAISRRTVTKYREAEGIPASRERRAY